METRLHVISELLTIGQAAKVLGVTLNTLRNWEKRGVLIPYRVGPRQDRRYEMGDILAFRGSK